MRCILRMALLGTVTDTSGATVPGVTITITEVRTNISRTAVTNESGNYTFSSLQDGVYRVEAELEGFRKFVREGVQVAVNTTVRVDIPSRSAARRGGDGHGRDAGAADRPHRHGAHHREPQVTEMPLAFNRNFQGILITVPGATRPFRPHSQFFNSQDSLSTQVNGQSRLANNVQIEGLDNNHRTGLLTVLIPAPDALETVSVTTSNYDAEFGRSGGAVTNVTLKSGTNDLKGQRLLLRQHRRDQRQRLLLAHHAAADLRAGRLHARRADPPQQVLLLRQLPAHGRRPRVRVPRRGADDADARRRFLGGADDDLRPADGQRRRLGPHAVRGQPGPGRPDQPDRARILDVIPPRTSPGGVRRAELPAGVRAREDGRPVRREAEPARSTRTTSCRTAVVPAAPPTTAPAGASTAGR
jgi:hypothetical protein